MLIDPTGVRTPFVTSQFETEHSYPDDDPYGDVQDSLLRDHPQVGHRRPGATVDADTVARAGGAGASRPGIPKPRYIVGASGKASVLARALLSDRMWDRVMTTGLAA